MFSYCENDPVSGYDTLGFSSTKNKDTYSSSYKGSVKKGFVISTKLKINNKSYYLFYRINNKKVLLFYFSENVDYATIVQIERARFAAEAIYNAVKSINKKYKINCLKGRTIKGINSELLWHYRAYYWGVMANNANPANIGSTDKKDKSYDNNAFLFEL